MKIEQLSLERYGAFTDRAITFRPDASLHVVLGANEAGKTSALSAIGDLLFGFGHTTPYDFTHESKTLRLGGVFRRRDGSVIQARRRKGTKNTLVDANDQPLPDDFLAAMLGGVTRDVFASEFGLTADTLRAGGTELLKAGGRLAETLAASSAGLTTLSSVRARLAEEADQLFTPRKSANRAFYQASASYDDASRRLRDAIVTPEATETAKAAVAAAQARYDALIAEHEAAGRDLAKFQRTMRARGRLARLDTLAAALADLADLPAVAGRTIEIWQAALADDARALAELRQLDQADAVDAEAVAALNVDEALLLRGATIDALRERLGAVRKAIDDLPRRSEAKRTAQEALLNAAQRLGLASHEELLARLPTDPALAEVKSLIEATRRAEAAQAQAEARRKTANQERDRILGEASGRVHAVDPEPLRQRLQALADIPTLADRQRREHAACDLEHGNLVTTLAALIPGVGSLDYLLGMELPDDGAIAAHDRSASQLAGELSQAKSRVATASRALETAEAELARFSRAGSIATPADLSAARASREAGFDLLEATLDDAAIATRRARLIEVRGLTLASDRIADQIVADSERSAQYGTLQDRVAEAQRDRHRAITDLDQLELRAQQAGEDWLTLWGAAGITPRSPSDMMKWRDRVGDISRRAMKLAERRSELVTQTLQLDANRIALVGLFAALGRTPDAASPVEVLYREAALRLDELQSLWADARARGVTQARAERDCAEAETELADAVRDVALKQQALPGAWGKIGLASGAPLSAAEAALAVWQGVPLQKQTYEREGRSVEGINADLAGFRADVATVVGQVARDLAGQLPHDALQAMTARLADARRAADARARLQDAAAKRAAARHAVAARREPVTAVLAGARAEIALNADDDLAAVIERLQRRSDLEAQLGAARSDLADIADGHDEATLRSEQAGLDFDNLPGEIERLLSGQKQLLEDIGQAHAAVQQAEAARDLLFAGRDAGGAARDRTEAASELLGVAERWLVRAAATRLADRAVQRHRALVQDPMLARAGALFAMSTAGAFSGLTIDYGNDDNPVIKAVRSSQDRPVEVAGLSEGTRDQLFLALRLALLERRTAEALPFIGDDLLASFDEARTASTLSLLASAGQQRQMIIFTHHRHVAEIGQSLPGQGVAVIEL